MNKLFLNARIYTPTDNGSALSGPGRLSLARHAHGALFSKNGIIEAVGDQEEVLEQANNCSIDMVLDFHGACMIPGFVDPHTHSCFASLREGEYEMRLGGMEYLEILERGGGILSSVQAVRDASAEKLFQVTHSHALAALARGTTTMEIKSGYGLDTENEIKMLEAIAKVSRETPLNVVPTFLGAHAVPLEYKSDPESYVDLVIEEMIPEVQKRGLARFCDVFCERGVFDLEQSEKILKAGKKAGMGLKIHADEVHNLGGAGLAASLKAASADHLLAASVKDLSAMAQAGVVGVLLPATAYSMKKPFAQAREMIDIGLPVALATDCNPGSSYCESMPFVMGLAVHCMGMSVDEALIAATLNGAYALGMAQSVGSLQKGKLADFLILAGESPAAITYHAGGSAVSRIFTKGEEMVFLGERYYS